MSGKLDQSLEDIVMTERKSGKGRPVRGRRVTRAKGRTNAPTGGVSKNAKTVKAPRPAKQPALNTIAANAGGRDGGKILVSGLPADVDEKLVKEYFQKQIGGVSKVLLTYGPNGQSRGIATVTFLRANSAMRAVKEVNGLTIDGNRKLKVEVIVGGDKAVVPETKTLGDRVTQTNATSKAAGKKTTVAIPAASKATKQRTRRPKNSRPKVKTADELDAEMTDYFGAGANGAAPVVNGTMAGGEAMDEIQ